ncbi:MAG: DNA cytosine methyltransferase [bacterium]|nr:DNA cytosine methyltransferase [bacterium]
MNGAHEREETMGLIETAERFDDSWDVLPSGLAVPAHLTKRLTAVDLFSGAGGFSLGLLEAGFHVVAAVDNDENCLVTYLTNLGADRVDIRYVEPEDEERLETWMERNIIKKPKDGGQAGLFGEGVELYEVTSVSGSNRREEWSPPGWHGVPVYWFGDASKLTGKRILDSIGMARGELDLVVGGPPCQGYSSAGKREVADPRNNLTFEFARLVTEMQPRTMCMENVPGIINMPTVDGGTVLDEVCRILERGDFGEYKALHEIMGGDDRAMIKRGAGKKRDRVVKNAPKEEAEDKKQGALF